MGKVNLRWALATDLEGVLGLLEEYHRQEGLKRPPRERIRQLLEDVLERPARGKILLAEIDGDPVGYALVVRVPSFEWASEVARLDEIFVQGRARQGGIGRRMIGFIEEYAASQGLPSIMLEVSVHNVAAREFYRAVGFQRVEREIYARDVNGPR